MPTDRSLASGLLSAGPALAEDIESVEAVLEIKLPRDLVEFVEQADGAEGFVAGAYLAMWPVGQIAELNRLARVAQFAADLVFFATDGGLEGYALDRRDASFINVPMIGMGVLERAAAGETFAKFLEWLAGTHPVDGDTPPADPARFGLIVHEITPVIFGGSPTDPANKVLVPLYEYAKFVGFWNDQVRRSG